MKGCRFKILPVSTVKNAHPPHLRGGGRGGEGEEGRERRERRGGRGGRERRGGRGGEGEEGRERRGGRGGEVKNENITFQVRFNPLQPKVSMHILHTALSTFSKVLTRRIKSFLNW